MKSALSKQNMFKAYCVVRGFIPVPYTAGPYETTKLAIEIGDPAATIPGVVYGLACFPMSSSARDFMDEHMESAMTPEGSRLLVFAAADWEEDPTAEDAAAYFEEVFGRWNEEPTGTTQEAVASWTKTLKHGGTSP
jgi:hypothetical protein